jgi:hypothetical protein
MRRPVVCDLKRVGGLLRVDLAQSIGDAMS